MFQKKETDEVPEKKMVIGKSSESTLHLNLCSKNIALNHT
jgi:hypothetical protein